jgi:type IV secretion system protein VirD4
MQNSDLENTRWAKDREINVRCKRVEFSGLGKVDDGIVVRAMGKRSILHGERLQINLAKPIHTLIVGASGSGKTSTFVSPSIEILQRTKSKPSLIITDPKGELYSQHSQGLRNCGYTVQVINLREPYKSTRWNCLSVVWDKYELSKNSKVEHNGGSYFFDNKKYQSLALAEIARQSKSQTLIDECYEDLNEIASALCPSSPQEKDPIWRSGAKSFIHGMLLAMLEDSDLGMMTKSLYTFGSLYSQLSKYMQGECEELHKYFALRVNTSKSIGLVNQVLQSPPNQMKSYMSSVMDAMQIFADNGVCALTSENEIDFASFDEVPTALFLIIPDERTTRYKLATMLINKIYQELVYKANENLNSGKVQNIASLQRNLYFLIDEFANLPQIENMDTKITAARSRKIWFVLIIQAYSQLDKVYGKDTANTIKGNCDINMYIGSTDQDTLEQWSKKIGNKKIATKSMSRSGGNHGSVNESFSVTTRPLMYPTELSVLNSNGKYGNTIVLLRGDKPIKSKFIQAHTATRQWTLSLQDTQVQQTRLYKLLDFDYDFKTRNSEVEFGIEIGEIVLDTRENDNTLTFKASQIAYEEHDLTQLPDTDNLDFLIRFGIDITLSEFEILSALNDKLTQAKQKKRLTILADLIAAKFRYLAIVEGSN